MHDEFYSDRQPKHFPSGSIGTEFDISHNSSFSMQMKGRPLVWMELMLALQMKDNYEVEPLLIQLTLVTPVGSVIANSIPELLNIDSWYCRRGGKRSEEVGMLQNAPSYARKQDLFISASGWWLQQVLVHRSINIKPFIYTVTSRTMGIVQIGNVDVAVAQDGVNQLWIISRKRTPRSYYGEGQ
ncbi:hypothetical protein Tco_0011421 [Tanacetum coccineum]